MTDFSKAYKYDLNGYYIGIIDCQIDPKATAVYGRTIYLLPADSTYSEPLPEKDGFKVKFDGSKWVYVDCTPPEPTPEELIEKEIDELKQQLNATDYKIIKCSECSLAGVDLPYDVAELHAERQAIRDRINELEELLPQTAAE